MKASVKIVHKNIHVFCFPTSHSFQQSPLIINFQSVFQLPVYPYLIIWCSIVGLSNTFWPAMLPDVALAQWRF